MSKTKFITITRDEIMQMSQEQLRREIAIAKGMRLDRMGIPNWSVSIADAYALEDEVPDGEDRGRYVGILSWLVRERGGSLWDFTHATAKERSCAWLIWYTEREV